MPMRCKVCGSLNVDTMLCCGGCGSSLSEADRVVFKRKTPTSFQSATGTACPYCGVAMEAGLLEVPSEGIVRPRWIGSSGAEPIIGLDFSFFEFHGHICRGCHCMLLTY